ncbi:hydantoin racemase [Komagataeibacter xylinus]|uniref:Hydantoin racemase n=1 Tax=Komagataeibacter xylinus TaxID=28448 RepID=A0A318PL57_KOMXY|nr:aspartate/glutamate racemase family protein [Komagataeibacter xylinus]AZV39826.1 hydantoin racemase [Komagataeibacter xylinus]PYD56753.1 hydantoin racemase [Komagataeibacter xylinus]GBQ74112.1 hydantoin racemase [Komagataeibacter xylinus NBRC 15237]
MIGCLPVSRLLLINPNTDTDMTQRMVTYAEAQFAGAVAIEAVTARFGARYLTNRVSVTIAGHAALDALACARGPFDAVLVACFGDPGREALASLCPVPVTGMAQASLIRAARLPGRFSIVTGGPEWKPMLVNLVQAMGLSARLASIRILPAAGNVLAQGGAAACREITRACNDAVQEDGAARVVLGGAGLAGFAARIAPDVTAPVLCSLHESLHEVLNLLRQPVLPQHPWQSMETVGLSAELRRYLASGAAVRACQD